MILAYCSDLIFSTRIRAEAAAAGASVAIVRSLEGLRSRLEAVPGDALAGQPMSPAAATPPVPSLVIVDLDAPDGVEAVRTAASAAPPMRVLGFVSHVRGDLAQAARGAGAGEVLARSAFVVRLPALLAEGEG